MGDGIIGKDILAMRKSCEKMEPFKRGDCPVCGYTPLRVSVDDITECLFCGWTSENPLIRSVEEL